MIFRGLKGEKLACLSAITFPLCHPSTGDLSKKTTFYVGNGGYSQSVPDLCLFRNDGEYIRFFSLLANKEGKKYIPNHRWIILISKSLSPRFLSYLERKKIFGIIAQKYVSGCTYFESRSSERKHVCRMGTGEMSRDGSACCKSWFGAWSRFLKKAVTPAAYFSLHTIKKLYKLRAQREDVPPRDMEQFWVQWPAALCPLHELFSFSGLLFLQAFTSFHFKIKNYFSRQPSEKYPQ